MATESSILGTAWRAFRQRGPFSVVKSVVRKLRKSTLGKLAFGPPGPWSKWLQQFQPDKTMLEAFRMAQWPVNKPKFSIIMPVFNTNPAWLKQAIRSVMAQTFGEWELWCIDDGSTDAQVPFLLQKLAHEDPRIHAIITGKNEGVSAATNTGLKLASGTHVLFMDHDDFLQPHALHRFAMAILSTDADLLYADEALTSEDLDHVHVIKACPAFSHDFYLNHPYFVHPVCAKIALARSTGGLNSSMKVSHDVDMVYRMLEKASTVAHIPDVLYRWRLHSQSTSHTAKLHEITQSTQKALEAHLKRMGIQAQVHPSVAHHNFFRLDHQISKGSKVAILIPTKNRADLLRGCLESLKKTVPADLADVFIIDHNSDDPETLALFQDETHHFGLVPYEGPFNFARMMNLGVKSLAPGKYSHYLFLNNDTVAAHCGWLEAMLGLACKKGVGGVGAHLLYPDHTLQHSGVIFGLAGPADHSHKFHPHGSMGWNGSLYCDRDYSAVTAACMLVEAKAFEDIRGFDESLAIGFNDTDLCLRLREKGYLLLQTPHAILFHLESQSRLADRSHPADTEKFLRKYKAWIDQGDPYYSPYLDHEGFTHLPRLGAKCSLEVQVRLESTPWAGSIRAQRKDAA